MPLIKILLNSTKRSSNLILFSRNKVREYKMGSQMATVIVDHLKNDNGSNSAVKPSSPRVPPAIKFSWGSSNEWSHHAGGRPPHSLPGGGGGALKKER